MFRVWCLRFRFSGGGGGGKEEIKVWGFRVQVFRGCPWMPIGP